MVNQHESIKTDEQLDELLEAFEREWSPHASYLSDFVVEHNHVNNSQGITELVRVDIDRRYAAGVEVDLRCYFETFPSLSGDSKCALAIAFEDFRSRRSRSLKLAPKRWSWLPGIDQAGWYVALKDADAGASVAISRAHKPLTDVAKRCSESSDAIALHSNWTGSRGPSVGDRFGEFQLLAILGEGAFSTVFLATQLGLASRYVALKVVRKLLDEPTHLARLQHTGIVPLFSLHRIGEFSALCMPYFGSATLADWLGDEAHSSRDGQSLVGTVQSAQMRVTSVDSDVSGAPRHSKELESVRVWNSAGAQPLDKLRSLDARQFVLWFTHRLAAALAHAHERGVIHGDLKPANVLLRNDGEPALIDFNLSKSFERDLDAWTGGTLPYMAPEQLQALLGQSTQIDASADVYALGILLFELIENHPPFPRPLSSAESDIKVALDSRKQPVMMTNGTGSIGLKAIIRKCLSLKPSDRYCNAIELLEDVEREVAHQPLLHAKEQFFSSRLPKLMRRYPRLFSAGPVALMSLFTICLLSTLAFVGWHRSQTLTAEARLARFRSESRLLLAAMLEPAPSQLDDLLAQSNQLASDFIGDTEKAVTENARSTDSGSRNRNSISVTVDWLKPTDASLAKEEFLEFLLAAVAMTCGSGTEPNEAQRRKMQDLLALCATVPELAITNPMLANLQKLVRGADPRLKSRYEAMMLSIEPMLVASDSGKRGDSFIDLLRARSDVRQGQARQALERLRFVEASPQNAHLYWMVSGDAQSQLAYPEAAIQAYGLAIGAAPENAAAYVKRAQELQGSRDFKPAEADYSKAIELAPPTASLYMRRALVREELADFVGAIDDMDAAIELEPKSNRMLFVRARLHQRAQHRAEYIQDYKNGLTITPKEVEDWVSRALAQLPRYPEKAQADLQEALRIDPASAVALQNLAHVESEHLHNSSAAMAALDQILQLSPDNQPARAGRCVLLARQGLVEGCLQDLEVLSEEKQRLLPSTLYQMGCAHALISNKHSASTQMSVKLLAQAIRRGYGAEVIATDPDLDALREHADFIALTTTSKLLIAN